MLGKPCQFISDTLPLFQQVSDISKSAKMLPLVTIIVNYVDNWHTTSPWQYQLREALSALKLLASKRVG